MDQERSSVDNLPSVSTSNCQKLADYYVREKSSAISLRSISNVFDKKDGIVHRGDSESRMLANRSKDPSARNLFMLDASCDIEFDYESTVIDTEHTPDSITINDETDESIDQQNPKPPSIFQRFVFLLPLLIVFILMVALLISISCVDYDSNIFRHPVGLVYRNGAPPF